MSYAISPSSVRAICSLLMFVLVGLVSSQDPIILSGQNNICPFDFLFHLGDGVFDNGNAIRIPPYGPSLPAAGSPYGKTYPGRPTGRWSDGLLGIDFGAFTMGISRVAPYWDQNASSIANGITFAVAKSTVLDRSFYASKGVTVPPYAASITTQMTWFKNYLNTICFTPTDCADKLGNSLFLFGDVEANDITYSVIHGMSKSDVSDYLKLVTQAQVDAVQELIGMGVTRIVLPGYVPIGCYPIILTQLHTFWPYFYDDFGCLIWVNDLVQYKNNDLKNAIDQLKKEFPHVTIFYADYDEAFRQLLRETNAGRNKGLLVRACCGLKGGDYDYDLGSECGTSESATACSNPSDYIHWDGVHLTQAANNRLSEILLPGALATFNCKTQNTTSSTDV